MALKCSLEEYTNRKKKTWIPQKLLKQQLYVLDAFVFQTVDMKFVLKILFLMMHCILQYLYVEKYLQFYISETISMADALKVFTEQLGKPLKEMYIALIM